MKKLVPRIQAWIDLLYSSESWFWIIHNDGKILHVNPETLLMLGLTENDILSKSLSSDSISKIKFNPLEFCAGDLTEEQPLDYIKQDGTKVWIVWRKIKVLSDASIIVGKDVSQYINQEEKLNFLEEEVRFKANVLEAIVNTSSRLLRAHNIQKALADTFRMIGEASQVDRVYYFEKNKNNNLFSQKVEWTRGQIKPEINNPNLQNIDLNIYEFGFRKLLRGESVIIRTADLEESPIKLLLTEQDIVSMINLPIFVDNSLFGFIGFDFCTQNITWTSDESNLLMVLSNNISNAIERIESQKKLEFKAAVLSAIGKTNEKLFKTNDILTTLAESFEYIGTAAQVDRVYFFQKNLHNDLFSQKVEWTKGNVKPEIDNPDLQDVDTSFYPFFYEQLQSGKPYMIHVTELEDGDLKDLLASQDIQSLLNIPITVFGKLIGFIGFDDCSQLRAWAKDELSILVSLANNISNAFQRNSNQFKLERKTAIMGAVGMVTEQLFKTENIFNTLYESFEIIGEAAGVDRVYYFEKNHENQLFDQKLEWTRESVKTEINNPNLQNIDMSIYDFYHSNTIHGKYYIIKTEEILDPEFKKIIAEQDIISLLNIPIMVFNEVHGIIGFDDCTSYKEWTTDEISILVSLANSLAVAIEKHQNQKNLQKKADILTAIGKTSEKLLNSNDIFQVIEESFEMVGKAIHADRVYYFEKNKNNDFFSQKIEWVNFGINPEIANPLLQDMNLENYPELNHRIFDGQPYIFKTSELSPGLFKDMMEMQDILTILNIPLKVNGDIYGFIGFDDCTQNRIWSEDEMSVLVSLGNNIANAIEKSENQQKIIESERNFREMNETIDDVFWLYNLEHNRVDYISPSCMSVFGCSQERYYKKYDIWKDYVLPEDYQLIFQAHEDIAKNGSYEVTYRISVNNEIRWIYEKSFAIVNSDGSITRNTGLSTDITNELLKQRELERLLELTNEQNQRLTNFAHIISHNIRSHSSNLSSLMDFLSQSPTKAEKELYMSLMQKSTDKLAETIQNLNDIITIQNYAQLETSQLNLYDEIEKTIHALGAEIKMADAEIKNNVPQNITLPFVPAYMESILLNFLSNAVKYRSEDRKLKVEFNVEKVNGGWKLSISDNGLGIDLAKHGHKLFGMFKTFHKNPEARGMGLFIAKSQIEALKGRVEVQSVVNHGTTFYIYFNDGNF